MTPRLFSAADDDYRRYAEFHNIVYPDYPVNAAALKNQDRRRGAQFFFERFLLEQDGEFIAVGSLSQSCWDFRPGKYHVGLGVLPQYRRQGIGHRMYAFLRARLETKRPTKLTASAREHREDGVRFLLKNGFTQAMRFSISHLDPTTFDPTPFLATRDRALASGVRALSLTQLSEQSPDCLHKLHALATSLNKDLPSPEPVRALPFEEFRELFNAPSMLNDGYFVGVEDDQFIGVSFVSAALADPTRVHQGLTGVLRSHRRRGVATLLKLHTIDFAQRYGARTIVTDNEENNPMYGLNLALGFVSQPAALSFENALDVGRDRAC